MDGEEKTRLCHFFVEEASRLQVVDHAGCKQRGRDTTMSREGGRLAASVGGQQMISVQQKTEAENERRHKIFQAVESA